MRPHLSPAALHALRAGLQLVQHELTEIGTDPEELPHGIGRILTNGGTDTPLASAQIDALYHALDTAAVERVPVDTDL
ncbi:MAG: hypothetical protein ABIL09_26205 [Gemmatimonadota bacterium]